MLKGYYRVSLCTKPYLKKFLVKRYGNPLIISVNNDFGMVMAAFLQRPSSELGYVSRSILIHQLDRYDSLLDIYFLKRSFAKNFRKGIEVSDRHNIVINRLFEESFAADMWSKVTYMCLMGMQVKEALETFCDCYDIEIGTDIQMKALLKKEERYRNEMKKLAPDLSVEATRKVISKLLMQNAFSKKPPNEILKAV